MTLLRFGVWGFSGLWLAIVFWVVTGEMEQDSAYFLVLFGAVVAWLVYCLANAVTRRRTLWQETMVLGAALTVPFIGLGALIVGLSGLWGFGRWLRRQGTHD